MAVQRGEIYFVNLNPVQGREQAGSFAIPRPTFCGRLRAHRKEENDRDDANT